jgi:cell division protein FtsQ
MASVRSRGATRRRTFASLLSLGFRRGNRHIGERKKSRSAARKNTPPLWRRALVLSKRAAGLAMFIAAFAGALYGGRYFVYHSPRLALREVRITGTRHLSSALIQQRATVEIGTNLLHIDSDAVALRLQSEPWIKRVRVRRELPSTLHIELVEHEPAALVSLESLYLCDSEGLVFKRAHPSEYGELPVLTGIGRAGYVLEPAYAREQIRTALSALAHYRKESSRPPIGEVHIDRFVGVTLYTRQGVALQLGQGDAVELDARLARFDVLWRRLSRSEQRPQMVYLNNRAHPDHITVRFFGATPGGDESLGSVPH